jgi:hypothetical protein
MKGATLIAAVLCCLAGCARRAATAGTGPGAGPTTRRVTDVDRRLAQPAFWYNQPATSTVTADDFDNLWAACERAARDRGFRIDREDFRSGVMTTHPLISKQWFELWRRDVVTLPAVAHSSLHTTRRTIRFELAAKSDGSFEASPKVLVERLSVVEHRITSASQYRDIFALTREESLREEDRQRNPLLQQEGIPPSYWYALGRDEALEKTLAAAIAGKVKPQGA